MSSMLDAVRNRQGDSSRKSLTPELFKKYSDFIYAIAGIRFQEAKSYFLSSKLQKRCDALAMDTFEEYYAFLQRPDAKLKEYHHLMDEITINETFFFRNQPQLELFETEFLRPLLKKRMHDGQRRFRIWSCAASTGDEAYTMALQILAQPEARNMQIEIIGTDICRDALEKAKKGEFSKYAVRNIPADMMAKYFTVNAEGNRFQISQDIMRMVKFQECNLIDSGRIRMLGKFDIAFCRNVLIYFDGDSKEVALNNIASTLPDDGYLIAGHSENLYSQRHIFTSLKEHSQAHAYQKSPPGTEKSRF